MANKRTLLWLVGGGTAGHVMPLLAVAEVLKQDASVELAYIGEQKSLEQRLAKEAGLRFLTIRSGKFRRYLTVTALILNIRDTGRLIMGIVKSFRLISKHRPALIFSKGGPVALPLALAAWMTHTPIVTHESDAVMGVSNRFMARFATAVLTAFPPNYYPNRYAAKIISVGLPIRAVFCRSGGTSSHRPMLLIMGGSQGSVAINLLVAPILAELLEHVSVTHITGEISHQQFVELKKSLPETLSERYTVLDFTPDIASYMRQASVVVVRSSSTIFELASLGKPMILIPLPSAANNHQVKNAEVFATHNAAITLRQENLTSQRLYETIEATLTDKTIRQQLKEGARTFSSCESAKTVAKLLKQYAARQA